MERVRVGLLGAHGRMGKYVSQLLAGEYSDRCHSTAEITNGAKMDALLHCEVVIDFATPEAMSALATQTLAKAGTHWPAFIVGSTGWKAEQRKTIEQLAQHTPVLQSANFSMGVQALLHALRSAAPVLRQLDYTPVIIEAHHHHKKDSPSGTAHLLQRAIDAQSPTSIQTHAIRAGEVIGEHSVTFYGAAERVVLGHYAQDRSLFARGALEVALWIAQKRRDRGSLPHAVWGMDTFFMERFT